MGTRKSGAVDLTGERFGRLLVINRAPNYESGNRTPRWHCICDCSNKTISNTTSLRSGKTQSCGCYNRELLFKANHRHGGHKDSLYSTWCGMKQRCENPNSTSYKTHGARGIRVCDEWQNDYASFAAYVTNHLGERPSNSHSIDRIDNLGIYEPGNIRYATPAEQLRNTRHNHNISYDGVTQCFKDWAAEVGLSEGGLRSRLYVAKMPIGEALTAKKREHPKITFQGKSMTLKEWGKETNIALETLRSRLYKKGWSIEETLTHPVGSRRHEFLVEYEGQVKSLTHWSKELGIFRGTLHYRISVLKMSPKEAFTTPLMRAGKAKRR